jgi:tetratricopeptide (TPR) repeat protein
MKKIALCFLVLFVASTAFGQKTRLTSAIVEFNQGDFSSALQNLNIVLSDRVLLDEESIAKAYLYKGKTLIQLYGLALKNQDGAAIVRFEMAIADAIDCFVKCKETNAYTRLQNDLYEEATRAYQYALNLAMTNAEASTPAKVLHFAQAAELANRNFVGRNLYLPLDLMAKAHLMLGDSTQALDYFAEEIASYTTQPPGKPDYYVAYTYYMLAVLHRYHRHDSDAALEDIEQGLRFLDEEFKRDATRDGQAKTLSQTARKDLELFQLDIYLKEPSRLNEAMKKFEQAVKNNPGNSSVRIAYASLLEKADANAAIVQYQKVIEAEPKNLTALFNLGALYTNLASEHYKHSLETDDFEESRQAIEQGDALFQKAYPLFQRALGITPDDPSTLRALIQISMQLGYAEDAANYKALLNK